MTETRMIMHKHYSIDELEKTNFWHRLEPEGVDFHYVYNKERKYVYFTPNSQTQFVDYVEKYSELARVRKMNNCKRTIFKRKIVSAILDKTKIWLPEIQRYINNFIGFDSYTTNTRINSYGFFKKPLNRHPIDDPPPMLEEHELLAIDTIGEQEED
jgi:hypothetical protein